MIIHETAIIDKTVELADDVEIGAYSIIKGNVKIGKGTHVRENVTIYGNTTIGCGNVIHPGAIVGNISQDLKYKGEETEVIIGDNNSIRECVTIHQGTADGGYKTVIGNNNLIMAYVHIAHDCQLGNNIIIANTTQLAGHIVIHDYAYIGGMVGVHQFVTFGRHCFVGFMSRINKDVPPFVTIEGAPARERGLNTIGLKRKNIADEDILAIRTAYNVIFNSKDTWDAALLRLEEKGISNNQYVAELVDFMQLSKSGKNGRYLEGLR